MPKAPRNPTNQNSPAVLYNAMIAPLIPYGIRGAIWYQANRMRARPIGIETLFPAMITNWRQDWNEGNFPFSLSSWRRSRRSNMRRRRAGWAELREAQRLTSLHLPNTGMAVITDVGEELDIHPRKKEPVGERLALLALATVYKQDVEDYGPVLRFAENRRR